MTLMSPGGTEQRIHDEVHENRNTANMREPLSLGDTEKDIEYVQGEQLSLEEIPSLTRSSAEIRRKCPTHHGPVPGTARKNVYDFLEHDILFFSCDEECKTPTPGDFNSYVAKEGDRKYRAELASKVEEIKLTPSLPRAQTQEEKIRERSRKGRERSLRTRRRNNARLKLLEENCVHLSRENKILRDLARSLAEQDDERAVKLLNEYRLAKEERPEPHKLMHPESYYMNLLSPLSVTALANTEEKHSNTQNVLDSLLSSERSVKPQASRGLHDGFNDKNALPQEGIVNSMLNTSSQANLKVSKSRENVEVSGIDQSVFEDPAYGDGKQFGFSLEEVCNQPLLSAEEIVDLVEQGAGEVEVSSL